MLVSQELVAVDAKQVSCPFRLRNATFTLRGFLAALAKASINDSFST